MSDMQQVTTINGRPLRWALDSGATVLETLRNQMGLTASRYGCGQEQCGACHVLIDGQSKPSCLLPVDALVGRSVVTLESAQNPDLPSTPYLKALQSAFIAEQAAQCGYCTSGMIIQAQALLDRNPRPTDAEVRTALDGNLCRCGAHNRIVRAVLRAAKEV